MISTTPSPPYYAVIFSSQMSGEAPGYKEMGKKMVAFASEESGFLGIENVTDEHGFGIMVSYWQSVEAILRWKENAFHFTAQEKGKSKWYSDYKVRICKVERDYGL